MFVCFFRKVFFVNCKICMLFSLLHVLVDGSLLKQVKKVCILCIALSVKSILMLQSESIFSGPLPVNSLISTSLVAFYKDKTSKAHGKHL